MPQVPTPPAKDTFHHEIVKLASNGGAEALAEMMASYFCADFQIHTAPQPDGKLKFCLYVGSDHGHYRANGILEVLVMGLVGEYDRMLNGDTDHHVT